MSAKECWGLITFHVVKWHGTHGRISKFVFDKKKKKKWDFWTPNQWWRGLLTFENVTVLYIFGLAWNATTFMQ